MVFSETSSCRARGKGIKIGKEVNVLSVCVCVCVCMCACVYVWGGVIEFMINGFNFIIKEGGTII